MQPVDNAQPRLELQPQSSQSHRSSVVPASPDQTSRCPDPVPKAPDRNRLLPRPRADFIAEGPVSAESLDRVRTTPRPSFGMGIQPKFTNRSMALCGETMTALWETADRHRAPRVLFAGSSGIVGSVGRVSRRSVTSNRSAVRSQSSDQSHVTQKAISSFRNAPGWSRGRRGRRPLLGASSCLGVIQRVVNRVVADVDPERSCRSRASATKAVGGTAP